MTPGVWNEIEFEFGEKRKNLPDLQGVRMKLILK